MSVSRFAWSVLIVSFLWFLVGWPAMAVTFAFLASVLVFYQLYLILEKGSNDA